MTARPFFHCHALWQEASGKRNGGHIMPDETVVAEPSTLQAVGLDGAGFAAYVDSETNFKLFGPAATAPIGHGPRRTLLRPAAAAQYRFRHGAGAFCSERGIRRAVIHGGVGSTIGARFEDGRSVENFATEVAITERGE